LTLINRRSAVLYSNKTTFMIQSPKRHPFKALQMTVTKIPTGDLSCQYHYRVFENGRELASRKDKSGLFKCCLLLKNHGIYPWVIAHLSSDLNAIGIRKPSKPPYALGLLDGVIITEDQLNGK
jgi:hypothetical protein